MDALNKKRKLSRPGSTHHLDAYRDGDHFYAAFDLPGVDPDTIDCTVERNVLAVRAE